MNGRNRFGRYELWKEVPTRQFGSRSRECVRASQTDGSWASNPHTNLSVALQRLQCCALLEPGTAATILSCSGQNTPLLPSQNWTRRSNENVDVRSDNAAHLGYLGRPGGAVTEHGRQFPGNLARRRALRPDVFPQRHVLGLGTVGLGASEIG